MTQAEIEGFLGKPTPYGQPFRQVTMNDGTVVTDGYTVVWADEDLNGICVAFDRQSRLAIAKQFVEGRRVSIQDRIERFLQKLFGR